MPNKTKLIIVDDHSLTLSGIKNIVEELDFVEIVGTANSGKEALELFKTAIPDIIFTDVGMDDINGIELSKIIKEKYPLIKIAAITQHKERWIIAKLINIGVDAIVLKSKIDEQELLLAIHSIKIGKKYYSSELAELFSEKQTSKNGIPYITTREKEILNLICKENTINQISTKLNVTNSTVETHRKNLCVKLKVKSQSGLVREAIKYGFFAFE